MTPEQIASARLSTALPSSEPKVRYREVFYMVAFAALLWAYLDRGVEADRKFVDERYACQKSLEAAEKHANVIATLLNEGHHVLTAPGAKSYCKTYRVKS